MKAAVITEPGRIEITEITDPIPGDAEVVVQVAAAGLCGTDLHVAQGEHGALPVVPGHEIAGVVVAVGSHVTEWRTGDRVAVDPNLPCRACHACRRGRANLCVGLQALGVTTNGGAAELVAVPAGNCYRVPENVDLTAAALIEPLACAVHGYDVLRADPGCSVLIYGAGTMGIMMLRLAKLTAAVTADVIDTNVERLAAARRVGCSTSATSAAELDRPQGWDVVIDATGNVAAIQDGLGHVASGGAFLQFGVASPHARVEIAPYDIYRREIRILGAMAVHNSFRRAVDLAASGIIDSDVLITRRARLDEYQAALDDLASGVGLKTVVVPGRLPSELSDLTCSQPTAAKQATHHLLDRDLDVAIGDA